MRKLSNIALLILLLIVCSCAAVGRNFSSQHLPNIRLNITTESQIVNWFGIPHKRNTQSSSDFESLIFTYVYAKGYSSGKGFARALGVEFYKGVVNGYSFTSAFKDDTTDFDITSRSKLVIGQSTMDEVEYILGKPGGKIQLPTNIILKKSIDSAPPNSSIIWKYHYTTTHQEHGLFKHPTKSLLLFFDDNKILLHKDYFEGEI